MRDKQRWLAFIILLFIVLNVFLVFMITSEEPDYVSPEIIRKDFEYSDKEYFEILKNKGKYSWLCKTNVWVEAGEEEVSRQSSNTTIDPGERVVVRVPYRMPTGTSVIDSETRCIKN